MFLIILKYSYGIELVNKHVEQHRIYLDKYYSSNKFICSGAQEPRTGGIILCNAVNREELNEIVSEDPFSQNKAVEYEIIEFHPSKFAAGFETFISAE